MAAKAGVTTVIASGKGADALLQVVAGEQGPQWLHVSKCNGKTLNKHPALLTSSVWRLRPSAIVPQAMI